MHRRINSIYNYHYSKYCTPPIAAGARILTTEYTGKVNGSPVTEGVAHESYAEPVSTKTGTTPSAITLQERELVVYDLLAASEDLHAIHWLVKLAGWTVIGSLLLFPGSYMPWWTVFLRAVFPSTLLALYLEYRTRQLAECKGVLATGNLGADDVIVLILLLDSNNRHVRTVARRHLSRLLPLLDAESPQLANLTPARRRILERAARYRNSFYDSSFAPVVASFLQRVSSPSEELMEQPTRWHALKSLFVPGERKKAAARRENDRKTAAESYQNALLTDRDQAPVLLRASGYDEPVNLNDSERLALRTRIFLAATVVFVPFGLIKAVVALSSTPQWAPLYLLIAASPFALSRYTLRDHHTQEFIKLCRSHDGDRLGDLVNVLEWPDEHSARMAANTLAKLLPACGSEQLARLTTHQRNVLYRHLSLQRADQNADLVTSVLQSLEIHPDTAAVTAVEKMVSQRANSPEQHWAQAAAEHCLPFLYAAREELLAETTLLRPVSKSDESNVNLVRPHSPN
jgi:hypothetical protein